MPKFHLEILPKININNDYHIEIDNKSYDEQEQYSKVSSIFFSNKYGSVKIKGFFDLSNKNIPSLIIINKLYLEISKQLLKARIYNFGTYKLEIEFNFSFKDINNLISIEEYLKNEYNCKIDYDNMKIYILLNEITNIDIFHKIGGELEKEDTENLNKNYINMMKARQKIKNFDEMLQFPKVSTIKSNIINDENIQNEIIEEDNNDNDSLNNIEMKDISYTENPFININLTDKIEEKKIETLSDFNLNMGLGNKKINYIKNKDINEINNLAYKEGNENYLNKIKNLKIKNTVNKLISNGALLMKKNIKTNILNTININGAYLLLNNKNDNDKYISNYKFSFNNILLDNDISNNADDLNDYKKIIFDNYITLLDSMMKNNNNNLNINDYTHLIMIYINQIQNKVDEIEKKQNEGFINNKIIEKYKKIISALKLFCILFLNCFMYKPENEYINNPNLFTDSFSDKAMSYRKRLLIEWCIDEQKNKIEKNLPNINNNNNGKDIKSNYEKYYSFGQIKKNIDIVNENNKKISLFLRAKMSNNNEKISKNNMYYFTGYNSVHGENNRQFRDIFIDKYNNDWLSFFIQSLLYEEKRDNYIVYSIELLTKNINRMNDRAMPIINKNNTPVYDINFILLKLYESYIKGDINEQIKYLKMLSYAFIIDKNNSSDHFIQYIICSILLKIIPIIFPKDDQINHEITDKLFIKKLTYNLLLKIIEELLINTPSNTYENYIQAIKLILLSFLSNKIKNKLINNLISRINIPVKSLNNIEENNPLLLNEIQKYKLLGYIYNSLCLWKNAYNCFISAKEYKYALEACINYAVAEIKNNHENTDFKEIFLRLNDIKNNMPILFVYIYQFFYLFIKYMSENKKNNIDINNINLLLKEFSMKQKYLYCDLIDDDTRGVIIDLLYKLLIKLNVEKSATGNNELILKKYVKTKTEIDMMNNALLDNIKYKNKIFC